MENLFYIIAVIGYFIYQTYKNFQKEQEKAKKRTLNVPQEYYEIPQEVDFDPVVVHERKTVQPQRDIYTENSVKEKHEQMVYEKMKREDMREYYNPEKPYRAPRKTSAVAVATNQPAEVMVYDEPKPSYDFDLRDAVIKEAILKRPY